MNIEGMSSDMSRLFQMVKKELDQQTITITESVTAKIMQNIDDKIKPLLEDNKRLRAEVDTLKEKIKKLDDMYRKNNLIIHGVKETEKNFNDLYDIIKEKMMTINVNIEDYEINKYHRLGKKQN